MANVYFKTSLSFTDSGGFAILIEQYRSCDPTVQATEQAITEQYVIDVATKENNWTPIDGLPTTISITEVGYTKVCPTANGIFIQEDTTEPQIIEDPIV
jgi:hypothetical protein